MKIDHYKKMANNKYKIYFEDGDILDTYDEVIINNNLLYKKELDTELYGKILEENKYYEVYNKCVKMLSQKLRSKKEVEDYLIKNEVNKKDLDSIINKLSNIGLINDKVYVKAYINDKINFSNAGPLKIEKELLDNNIDINIIKEELDKIDNEILQNKVSKYIEKKAKTNKHSLYYFKEKMLTDLLNMGYHKDMILEYLDNIEIKNNIELEYCKIYSKLSRKYQDNELKRNIKNKLYQKGYSREEIDNVIEKVDF